MQQQVTKWESIAMQYKSERDQLLTERHTLVTTIHRLGKTLGERERMPTRCEHILGFKIPDTPTPPEPTSTHTAPSVRYTDGP